MALAFRIVGRRRVGTVDVVDVEWYDDGGAVVRRDLVDEAERLEARAVQLRADALTVPDQYAGAWGVEATDDAVIAAMDDKRPLLLEQLGLTE